MAFPAFNTAGSNTPNRVVFNSGYIDFGNTRLVNVDNIKIDYKYSEQSMYVLNSIKIANLARHSQAVTVTGTVKTFSPEMEGLMFGSSTSSGGNIGYIALDGQPSLLNPTLTAYDQNNNEYQYQITGALFTADSVSFTNEQFTGWTFTLTCIDINLVKVSGV